MDVSKKKALNRLALCFLIFLAMRVLEELVVTPFYTNTQGLIACGGGIIVLFLYIRFIRKPLEWMGLPFIPKKIFSGLLFAGILTVVCGAVTYAAEYLYYLRQDGIIGFHLYYKEMANAFGYAPLNEFAVWMFVGLLLSLVHAIFYEFAFRGLFFTLSRKLTTFGKANILQAAMYTLWYLVAVFRVLMFGNYSKERLISLFVFTIIYEFIASIKLGLLREYTGTIWVCFFDHLAFGYLFDILHVTFTTNSETLLDFRFYYRLVGFQVVSLIIVAILYKSRQDKLKKAAETAA